jgi:hypothetical protein
VPEDAFISPEKYTNAFFGFALPLPQIGQLQEFAPATHDRRRRTLFGLRSYSHGISVLLVTAIESKGSLDDVKKAASGRTWQSTKPEIRGKQIWKSEKGSWDKKAASGSTGQSTKPVTIAGKQFWKSEWEQESPAGMERNYATQLNGYVVVFTIASLGLKLAPELEQAVESLTFFDPAKAKEAAGPDSRPYNPSGSRAETAVAFSPTKRIGNLSLGVISGNVYSNDELALTFEFPADWHIVDRAAEDKVIEAGHEAAWGTDPGARLEHEWMQRCARVLLYVTKYPVGSSMGIVNPAMMIMASDPECFPGAPRFPTTTEDGEGISRVGGAIQEWLVGASFTPSKLDSVGALSLQGHLMLVIPGTVAAAKIPGSELSVRSSAALFFTSLNDYWVAFTFMSRSESAVWNLMRSARIAFLAPRTQMPPEGASR